MFRYRRPLAALLLAAALTGGSGLAHAEPEGTAGDPTAAAQYWGRQHYDDCALMAVADVVGEVTGSKPSEEDVIALATSTPSSKDGAPPIYVLPPDPPVSPAVRKDQLPVIRDLPILLNHYGVGSVFTDDSIAANGGPPTGIPALAAVLGEGKKVIVSLNGETIWDIPGDRTVHDHDVVVTGIDIGSGVVHLNDSAHPTPDSQVSTETFDAAWKTSDRSMVLAG